MKDKNLFLVSMPDGWTPDSCDACPNYYDKCYGHVINAGKTTRIVTCPLHEARPVRESRGWSDLANSGTPYILKEGA